MRMSNSEKIICALDTKSTETALQYVEKLNNYVDMFKLGLEYYMATGNEGLRQFKELPHVHLFLDLKFYDIPNTVYQAISSLPTIDNIKLMTVHASGGVEMIERAREAAIHANIIAVTHLTSHNDENALDIVLRNTEIAVKAGAFGIVCSAQEVKEVRARFGKDLKIIVPGIRPAGTDLNDQKRVGTPNDVINDGADYLVIGRPITQADDPVQATKDILESIK